MPKAMTVVEFTFDEVQSIVTDAAKEAKLIPNNSGYQVKFHYNAETHQLEKVTITFSQTTKTKKP